MVAHRYSGAILVAIGVAGGARADNTALYFDGNDYAVLPDHPVFHQIEAQDRLTIEAWVRIDRIPQGWYIVADKYNSSRDFGWTFQTYQSGNAPDLNFVPGPGPSAGAPWRATLGQWYHVAMTYERGAGLIRFFVNGSPIGERAFTADVQPTNAQPMYLGFGPSGGDEYSVGALDELRLWDRALSPEEVEDNWDLPLYGDEPGLIGYWRFDEGAGEVFRDDSPTGLDGQLGGGGAQPRWVEGAPIGDFPRICEGNLIASDAGADDRFGARIAVDGDTMLVGALLDDHEGGTDAGSVYVFERRYGAWLPQARLTADDAADGDEFGSGVAIDGDVAVIGARNADHSGFSNPGAAYVFERTGNAWPQTAKLIAPDAQDNATLGEAVAINGATIVLGAPNARPSGSAYVFVLSNGEWILQAQWDGAGPFDFLGADVAVDSDTAVIGAPASNELRGSAQVFVRSGDVWEEQAVLIAQDWEEGDFGGVKVTLDGDTAVLGSNQRINDEVDAGAAHVFVRTNGVWSQQARLTAAEPRARDFFASIGLALAGDLVVAGAYQDDHQGGVDAGSASVFVRSDGQWSLRETLVAADASEGDWFGIATAIADDEIVVGASHDEHHGLPLAGSVYVFDARCDVCGPEAVLTAKCKGGGTKVTGSLKKATPDTPVTFTLDGENPVEATTNRKGKAKVKYTGQAPGAHTVGVCALEEGC